MRWTPSEFLLDQTHHPSTTTITRRHKHPLSHHSPRLLPLALLLSSFNHFCLILFGSVSLCVSLPVCVHHFLRCEFLSHNILAHRALHIHRIEWHYYDSTAVSSCLSVGFLKEFYAKFQESMNEFDFGHSSLLFCLEDSLQKTLQTIFSRMEIIDSVFSWNGWFQRLSITIVNHRGENVCTLAITRFLATQSYCS